MENVRQDKEAKKAWYRLYRTASPERKKQMRDAVQARNTAHDITWARESMSPNAEAK